MNAVLALGAASELLKQLIAISAVIAQANAEGRDVTIAELDTLKGRDDVARANFVVAIEKARLEGR